VPGKMVQDEISRLAEQDQQILHEIHIK